MGVHMKINVIFADDEYFQLPCYTWEFSTIKSDGTFWVCEFQFPCYVGEFNHLTLNYLPPPLPFQFPCYVGEFNSRHNHPACNCIISIPMLRGGVQRAWFDYLPRLFDISIPMLRGGVQLRLDFRGLVEFNFNSHATWGSSTLLIAEIRDAITISIPMLRGGVQR